MMTRRAPEALVVDASAFALYRGCYSAEISELGLGAMPLILALKSGTGTVRYILHKRDTNQDSEVLAWTYLPDPGSDLDPATRRTSVVVYND